MSDYRLVAALLIAAGIGVGLGITVYLLVGAYL